MLNIQYVYTKARRTFGRHCKFSDLKAQILVNIDADPSLLQNFIKRNPIDRAVQFAPTMSLQEVNTTFYEMKCNGVNHFSGGWPKEIDSADSEQTFRYTKKLRKDEGYATSVMSLCETMNHCVKQNNVVDIYHEYFDEVSKEFAGPPHVNVDVVLRRDIVNVNDASASIHLCWFPDSMQRIVSSHCNTRQIFCEWGPPSNSFIWNLPNMCLETTLRPPSSAVCIEYNPRDNHSLSAGLCSGQVAAWDTRKGETPCQISGVSESHVGVAWQVRWVMSKSGMEFLSAGADGRAMIWDLRRLSNPLETFILDPTKKMNLNNAECVFALDYDYTIPSKFMVATNRGNALLCNRKPKEASEVVLVQFSGHETEINAIQRNPFFNKTFMSVGNYTIRIWSEEMKDFPIFLSPYQIIPMTDGCWSPTRANVFFTSTLDGCLTFWDLLYHQNGPVMTAKIGDDQISCIRPAENGQIIATGSSFGLVNLISLSEGFYIPSSTERAQYMTFIEREVRREKILEARMKEKVSFPKSCISAAETKSNKSDDKRLTTEELLDECEKDFFAYLEEMKKECAHKRETEAALKIEREKREREFEHSRSTKRDDQSSDSSNDSESQSTLRHVKKSPLDDSLASVPSSDARKKKRSSRTTSQKRSDSSKFRTGSTGYKQGFVKDDTSRDDMGTIPEEKLKPNKTTSRRRKDAKKQKKDEHSEGMPIDKKHEQGSKSGQSSPDKTSEATSDRRETSPSKTREATSEKKAGPPPGKTREATSGSTAEEGEDNGTNNSALDALTLLVRQSQNNSNLDEWELTPRQVLSRIMNDSRILTLKRTSQTFDSQHANASTATESHPPSDNALSVKDVLSDEENQFPVGFVDQ